MLVGDFNSKSLVETISAPRYTMTRYTQFASWINDLQLADLGFMRPFFTWSRGKNKATRVQSRLNRAPSYIY